MPSRCDSCRVREGLEGTKACGRHDHSFAEGRRLSWRVSALEKSIKAQKEAFGEKIQHVVVKHAETNRRKVTSRLKRSEQYQLQQIVDGFVRQIKPIYTAKSSKQSKLWEDPSVPMEDMDGVSIIRSGPNRGATRIDL